MFKVIILDPYHNVMNELLFNYFELLYFMLTKQKENDIMNEVLFNYDKLFYFVLTEKKENDIVYRVGNFKSIVAVNRVLTILEDFILSESGNSLLEHAIVDVKDQPLVIQECNSR